MAAIELGAPYTVSTPDQSAWFDLNQPDSSEWVGYVTGVTGLDSPEVRENALEVPAGDGGYHGEFWHGRRPWTIEGIIQPQFPIIVRGQSQELIEQIMGAAMRLDGFLTWTPSDGIAKFLQFRCQQPPRITTGQSNADKRFMIAGVSADWRIRAATIKTSASGTSPTVVNLGKINADPQITLTGPVSSINNSVDGKAIHLSTTLLTGHAAVLDLTGRYPTYTVDGSDAYANIDPLTTDWDFSILPGTQHINVVGGGTAVVRWYDSWL